MSFESWLLDVQIAWRSLRRARGFSALAILTLATGIAGSTAMFALIQGVLLRPLPVHAQDRLFVAWTQPRGGGLNHVPYQLSFIQAIARESALLEAVAPVSYSGTVLWTVVDGGDASYIDGAAVGGEFFNTLGVRPILGRALTAADDTIGADGAVVISHRLWQRRFGGNPAVLGRPLVIFERPHTVVGVMPPDVEYPRGAQAWMTLAQFHAPQIAADPAFRVDVDLVGRMRPGVSVAQATAELQALTTRLEAERAGPSRSRDLVLVVRPFAELIVGDARSAMLVLFGAVGVVLLVASANVANLLLMRGEHRRTELAMRTALGAGRARLTRLVLAESVILALGAGVLGTLAASSIVAALSTWSPVGLPRVDAVRIDPTVVIFTVAVALVAAFLAGVPALSATRVDLNVVLRGDGRTLTRATQRGRRVLVVAQVALAVLVVAVAAGLTGAVMRLQALDMGIAADRLVMVPLSVPRAIFSDRVRHGQLLDALEARLAGTGRIESATAVHVGPFAGTAGWDVSRFAAEGQSHEQAAANIGMNLESVRPSYFATFDIALVRGRTFDDRDRAGATLVAIVSEDVAARVWPGQDALGKRLKFGGVDSPNEWRTIVGVVAPTRYRELVEPRPSLYLPADQFIGTAQNLVLRTTAPLAVVGDIVRATVAAVDDSLQVMRVAPFAELLDRPLARPRFNARLLSVFGATALLLSAVGLYGVMAANVRQRQRELGLRISLGATAGDVRTLILSEGARLAGAGALIGLAVASGVGRLLHRFTTLVTPLDTMSLASASGLLVVAALVACYLPARRAARVDAAVMLRGD
jgi:putative ABC transport system permease protein